MRQHRHGGTARRRLKAGAHPGAALVASLVVAATLPWSATAAGPGGGGAAPTGGPAGGPAARGHAYVPSTLLSQAQSSPDASIPVIVQGDGSADAGTVAQQVADAAAHADTALTDAAQAADQSLHQAQSKADTLAGQAATAKAVADAKAAKAARTGTPADKSAAKQAARNAAGAQQEADAAQTALTQAQTADDAASAALSQLSSQILQQQVTGTYSAIDGVAATLTGDQIDALAAQGDGVASITPDAPVQATGWSNRQLWPYVSGSAQTWKTDDDPGTRKNMPSIAVVDSGIQSRPDFGRRIVASVNLEPLDPSPGDGRGHGTFVAGIAAGAGKDYAGANPDANLVDVKALGSNGMGLTSDVIRACQWILDNQARYDIRVANFSLDSAITAPFYLDPLDQAVEQLWFHGITVVAAAGNYGSADGPSGVLHSPADDPFVITVGAVDIGNSPDIANHTIAPWSAWGYTVDGFAKPELSAPGRYMIGPVPDNASLLGDFPGSLVAPGYMELSGTSFAAPVVSAAAATLLAKHPNLTPDQVKGALMLAARPLPSVHTAAGGVGEVAVDRALGPGTAPDPNAGLEQFVKQSGPRNAQTSTFDVAAWVAAARASASWNSAAWSNASWSSASWSNASWSNASWSNASWNNASWSSASWSNASWSNASWSNAARTSSADGDVAPLDQAVMSPDTAAAEAASVGP